jgi:hypothetical protein
MPTYAEKLKDPRWQKKRLEILNRDNFTCLMCGDDKSTLHVHHGYYERGLDPWEYSDDTLATLCEDCHDGVEAIQKEVRYTFAFMPCDTNLRRLQQKLMRVMWNHLQEYKPEKERKPVLA